MYVYKIDISYNSKNWLMYLIIEIRVYIKRQREG
jgi:hypothetical protein